MTVLVRTQLALITIVKKMCQINIATLQLIYILNNYLIIATSYVAINQGCRKQYLIDQSMHDGVVDLWAWHCICSGIATPGLARASVRATGLYSQSNTCKNTVTSM